VVEGCVWWRQDWFQVIHRVFSDSIKWKKDDNKTPDDEGEDTGPVSGSPQQGEYFSRGQAAPRARSPSSCHVAVGRVQSKDCKQCLSQVGLRVPLSLREFKPCCAANPPPSRGIAGSAAQLLMWINRDKFPGLLWLEQVSSRVTSQLQGGMGPVPCYTCSWALMKPQRSEAAGDHDVFGVKHRVLCLLTPGDTGVNVDHGGWRCWLRGWVCPLPGSQFPRFLQKAICQSTNTMYSPVWHLWG